MTTLRFDAVESQDDAIIVTAAIIRGARRALWIYSRELDPGLLDAPDVLDAMRALATGGHAGEIRILLQDAETPQRAHAPLIGLAQRLPSIFLFREVADPVDRAYPAAFVCSDAGGFYYRGLGHRFDGEADLHAPARARQLSTSFDRVWERSRLVTEYRGLGI
jgi:hypothetical protein